MTKLASTDNTAAQDGGTSQQGLSSEDVQRLLGNDSLETRERVAVKMASNYSQNAFQDREAWVAEQIFRVLMKDTEVKVRQALSNELKDADNAPRDVIVELAQDEISVAGPMLEYSKVLSDGDLVKIISSFEEETERLQSISKRGSVNGRVSDALIDTGQSAVVKTLLDNDGATISDKGYGNIMESHAEDEAVIDAMVERHLPGDVVEKLVHHVSQEVANGLQEKYSLSEAQVKKYAKKTSENVTLDMVDQGVDGKGVQLIIDQMHANDRLSPSIIIAALCKGNLEFFERALAKLANVPAVNAHKVIGNGGTQGFQSIYQKSGLPKSMYESVHALLYVIRKLMEDDPIIAQKKEFSNRVVQALLHYAEDTQMDNMSYLIALVRQHAQS